MRLSPRVSPRRAGVATGALALAATLWVAAGASGGAGPAAARPPDPLPGGGHSDASVADTSVAGLSVAQLQDHLRGQPRDIGGWAALAVGYVEQARRTGDVTLYPKAGQAVDQALELARDDDRALTAAGTLAVARHDFAAALRWADRAVAVNPYSAAAHLVRADALTELGRYPAAEAAATRADRLRPGLASASRLSYLAELRGDVRRARALLGQALGQAGGPAETAFVRFHLGELARGEGDYARAGEQYRAALKADPAHLDARAASARLAAARGDVAAATAAYRDLVARAALPHHALAQGELLESLGRREEARQAYAVVEGAALLAHGAGVGTDLEVALFEADHGDRRSALRGATAEWRRRGGGASIPAADALAWALHVNGRDAEALRHARTATARGTRDALLLYHRGMIEHALGRAADARSSLTTALALDPRFSPLHAPRARDVLARDVPERRR